MQTETHQVQNRTQKQETAPHHQIYNVRAAKLDANESYLSATKKASKIGTITN